MIKVSEAGDKGCSIEIYGNAEIVAQQYVSLTATLNGEEKINITKDSKYTDKSVTVKEGSKDITKNLVLQLFL